MRRTRMLFVLSAIAEENHMFTNPKLIGIYLLGAILLQPVNSGAQPVTKVTGGYYHSLFLKGDGSLWGMGENLCGQLGDGSNNNTNRPELIGASGVTALSAGGEHSLFLKSDG